MSESEGELWRERRWPSESEGPWRLRFRWTPSGPPRCVEFQVSSIDDDHEVSTTLLRSIPLGTLLTEMRYEAGRVGGMRPNEAAGWLEGSGHPFLAPPPGQKGPRRVGSSPKYGAKHYVEVAEAYVEAARAGLAPTATVADRWGVSRATASRWIARCRMLGLVEVASADLLYDLEKVLAGSDFDIRFTRAGRQWIVTLRRRSDGEAVLSSSFESAAENLLGVLEKVLADSDFDIKGTRKGHQWTVTLHRRDLVTTPFGDEARTESQAKELAESFRVFVRTVVALTHSPRYEK